ncbi:hypothetical protein [uncultured Aquimarina sp.]|uniref:hypothetical protein n=1 Tax=uncultured Aquimarina sp. TaxID=575652 RepID=UPI00262C4995|nr:hypothetical protein [uncultured Aquimarina sp.]
MHKRVLTYVIALFFTVSFLVPRVTSLHALSHLSDDDTPISCEICDIIVDSHQFDLVNDDNFYIEIEGKSIPSSFVVVTQYNAPQEKILSPAYIYNKPPPLT